MAGKINQMINRIIEKKSNGNAVLKNTVKTKLILKGINPDKFDNNSEDDPEIISKLKNVASEFGITL